MDSRTPVEPTGAVAQYLTFSLLGEEYAVGLLKVREILEYDTVTRVPRSPAWVRGAINLRGRVVPVVDLAVRFGHPQQEISRRTCIVILDVAVEGGTTVVGILVDSVSQVIDLRDEEIEDAPAFGTKAPVEELVGVAPLGKKFVLILDVDRVLSSSEAAEAASVSLPPTETPAGESVAEEGKAR